MKISQLSIDALEAEIKRLYKICRREDCSNAMKCYLVERRHRLNEVFQFMPDNTAHLCRVNKALCDGSEKVLRKTVELSAKLRKEMEDEHNDFLQDFEIEGTINVSYNGNNSLIDFDPETEVDELAKNDFHIAEILDFSNKFPLWTFYEGENLEPIIVDYSISLLAVPELKNIRFCSAFLCLCADTYYALSDIVRINDFWNEVTVCYQNFNKI